MSSPTLIVAAIAVFVIAAMLFYQANSAASEHFQNLPTDCKADEHHRVPADLNRAPLAVPDSSVPGSTQRPATIPGAPTGAREPLATRKDLQQLDTYIMVWLEGAALQERERPGSLTPEQLQRRVILQGRLADLRTQVVNDMITDTYNTISSETLALRRENAGWRMRAPSMEALYKFGEGLQANAFLTATQYAEFRQLFDAALNELQAHTQPNPLERVRLQQLQVIRQDIQTQERRFHPPPVRVAAAQLFLRQMLKADQPLPTLFSMEPNTNTNTTSTATATDVIGQLRDIQWNLSVTYDPAGQELKRAIAAMMERLQAPDVSPQEVIEARIQLTEFQEMNSPPGILTSADAMPAYEPKDVIGRAQTLCRQIREAFPHDAAALGCSVSNPTDTYDAETVINTVCSRLRYSVPTVDPAQFNCPVRSV
jgi:hypothetical protein